MIPYEWIEQARTRIDPFIRETPLYFDPKIQAFIKWENNQATGSFKLRGASNKILLLEQWERDSGLVCASAGNHGQAVGLMARKLGLQADVFVSENASPVKLDRMRALGVQLHFVSGGYGDAESAALVFAVQTGKTWVSPYNDGQVIAGAGTVALESLEQLDGAHPAAWLVPVGGGGLVSGIGSAIGNAGSKARLIGIQPEVNAYLHHLINFGSVKDWDDLPSLADGLTGTVEENSVTIPIVRNMVDELMTVSEAEIARAVAYAWIEHHQVIEGSGAVTLAGILAGKVDQFPVVAVVSGGNIDPGIHSSILKKHQGKPV